MVYFETCFGINVNVYDRKADGTALSIYKSICHYTDTMYLNMFEHHLSYISKFTAYASKYQCRTCERHFNVVCSLHRHQRTCKGLTKYEFPGGFYTSPKTVFDKLEEYGIDVPRKERIFPWFVVYDFEAMLVPILDEGTEKLTWTAKHVPISVSICSNVDDLTDPRCLVDPDIDSLVGFMFEYMQSIASRGNELARKNTNTCSKL